MRGPGRDADDAGSQPAAAAAPPLPEAELLRAGDLLLAYTASPDGAKHAAKLAAALGLQRRHVRDWAALAARVQELLGGRGTAGAAVRLMMQIEARGPRDTGRGLSALGPGTA